VKRAALLLLTLLACACEAPWAFTLPLPLGGSLVIPLGDLDECRWKHERRHQEQIARMGSSRFLAAIAAEHIDHGRVCGTLEWEAFEAEWACDGAFIGWSVEEKRRAMGCLE
jgi:hypothetical protein